MKVYKYLLNGSIGYPMQVELPEHSKILTIGIDEYTCNPCLWARVDDKSPHKETREVLITGTGFELLSEPYVWGYLNTYKTNGGLMVWHCFVKER